MDAFMSSKHISGVKQKRSSRIIANRSLGLLCISCLAAFALSSYEMHSAGLSKFQAAFGVRSALADEPLSGHITVLSDIAEGDGSYEQPFVIDSNTVDWRVDIEGDNKENALYRVSVHLDYIRSCATKSRWDDLTYQDLLNRNGKFSFTAAMTGWYYLRVDINEGGEYEEYYEARQHIYFRVPPINPYSLPYDYPLGNQKPDPDIEITNAIQGSGTYTDPFYIDSPIVSFRLDGISDPDGANDLVNGVFLWAIQTTGHHPVYAKGQDILEAKDTYLYYPEIDNTIFNWDTRERPSQNDLYHIVAAVIDQHGEKDSIRIHFKVSTSCSCTEWSDLGCGQGTCATNEMTQIRSCSPLGCSIETQCVESPICTIPFDKEDINQDGAIDHLDVQLSIDTILGVEIRPEIILRADVNEDGKVNVLDTQLVIRKVIEG
jgi:hypothetical protein